MILLHPPIKRHRSCEPHLFGQVGFLASRIVKVVLFGRTGSLDVQRRWTSAAIGCAWSLTCGIMGRVRPFDVRHHVARSIGRIGARNAKVTETLCEGFESVHDVGALLCAGWVQRISVPAEQPCSASNTVVNHNRGNRGNTRAQVWWQLPGYHYRRV